jgi:putative membrane protein
VSDESSLSRSMKVAVKRYSSLFRLPAYRKVLAFQTLLYVIGLALPVFIISPDLQGLMAGIVLGVSVLLINIIVDYAVSAWVLRDDPVFDFRRTAAFSLFCWMVWLFFVYVGLALYLGFGLIWWIRLVLLGFSAVLIFRFVVFNGGSTMRSARVFAASMLQPFVCIIPFLTIWEGFGYVLTFQLCSFLIFSAFVAIAASFVFLDSLNRIGRKKVGMPSISILKAFILNWVTGLNGPFEEVLEKLGEERDTSVSLMKFVGADRKVIVAVPSVHPGPFKNIGSSPLPSLLKESLEKRIGCVACVPHGLFGHEFDLASQAQNKKVIDYSVLNAEPDGDEAYATTLFTHHEGSATASCQAFGRSAFVSFTLAPKTTEDFPPEFGSFVRGEASKMGFENCVIVNAHNCLGEEIDSNEAFASLKKAAIGSLHKALSAEQNPFEIGANTSRPSDFGLEDGMGNGGITVVAVKTGGDLIGYVVIDGNNMVSGLREEIQASLAARGFSRSEVFTTDTHSVNAVVLTERGYNPVGEIMDHSKLITYVEEAALRSVKSLESAKMNCVDVSIPKVKVIGERQLEALCLLIDNGLRRAKRMAAPIFVGSGVLLILFLLLL